MNGARRTGHYSGAKRTEIELREERMVEHRDVHRGDAVSGGAFLLLDGCHDLYRIELLEEHHRRPVVHAAHHAQHTTEAVEERHGDADTVAAGKVLACTDPETVVRDIPVRKLNALREARSSGGVLHVHDIVHVALCLARKIRLLRRFAGKALDLVQRIHAAVLFST